MVFPIVGGNQSSGDIITNSLRFNDGDSPVLSRDPSSEGNRRTFTISAWVKRCKADNVDEGIFNSNVDSAGNRFAFGITSAGQLNIYNRTGGTTYSLASNDVLRDPSAWYHCVCIIDTTDSTEADRQRIYINGTRVTSFADNSPVTSQNAETAVSRNDTKHAIGDKQWSSDHFDGYIAEHYYLDGVAYEPTYFAETNDNGVWVPKEYTGGNFGTNGHFLQFKQTGTSANASGIGADTSGTGNHYTVTNLTATDVTTDTPQNNFATLDPVNKYASPLVTEGNLEYDSNSSSGSSLVSTIAPSSGKWYCEVKLLTSTLTVGVAEVGKTNFDKIGGGASRPQIDYTYAGDVNIDGSDVDDEATYGANDIIGILLNLDDGEVIFQKNGSSINSGTAYNLHTNTTHENTGFYVQTHTGGGNTKASFNFGNPAFAISSGNSDADGHGNFEYSVPSGYFALCTKNLAEYG